MWGYQDGIPPAEWPREYRTCGGRRQSPIDIQTSQIVVNERLGRFDLSDLNMINNIRLTLKNNGHTVEVDVEGRNNLAVIGGGLPGPYLVKQFHFHWGSQDSRGSEHDINGRFFPMEMHVVTYSQRYRMFEEAKNATGGLAVLSFLFDVGADNPAFDEMISHMNEVQHKDDHVEIQAFPLGSLFPRSTDVFYRYYGGLTTPPCYESVIWTIFQEHIRISERQINQFRHLGDRHFVRFRGLSDNYRPTQPLNGRYVYTNTPMGYQYRREGTFGIQPQRPMSAPNRQFGISKLIMPQMHVVTYSQRYRMFEEAKNATGGLAVLSFLFDIGPHNPAFDELIGHMSDIRHKDDHVDIQTFSLRSLFPRSTKVFYRYYGGLTTPPCFESVIWTIFQEHIRISEGQINQFRRLGDRHFLRFRPLSNNFRPTQPLNGRYVYTNDRRGYRYQRQSTFGRQPQQPVPAPNRPLVYRPQVKYFIV
ncbi:carbonic anhydrase 1-like [Mytilus galloprovincialis]|uniref:carbonic anhydrase 1-like n=1 Tax=Mytilus galloprovincialis TaxID=29158 RepID=UPI003F7B6ABE